MRSCRTVTFALTTLALLALPGCGKDAAQPATGPAAAPENESHKTPHGGALLELGQEEGHVEVLHDQAKGILTLYVFGSALDLPLYVERPGLTVQTKGGPVEVSLSATDAKQDGSGHTWTAQHDALKAEPLDGRLRLKIGTRSYQSPLEVEGHTHK